MTIVCRASTALSQVLAVTVSTGFAKNLGINLLLGVQDVFWLCSCIVNSLLGHKHWRRNGSQVPLSATCGLPASIATVCGCWCV